MADNRHIGKLNVRIIGIARHRMATDGEGSPRLLPFMVVRYVAVIVSIRNRWVKAGVSASIRRRNCMPRRASTSFISSPQTAA